MKCDETKPECNKCTSTGRKCDGYSTLPFSRRDLQAASRAPSSRQTSPFSTSSQEIADALIPRLVTDPAFNDVLEKRYFQFFRQQTVASTNSLINSRFWDRVVLQACHTEPAVKHAVLALSSIHQLSHMRPGSDEATQHALYAEKQHYKALEQARVLIASSAPEDVDRILVACIIFIIFESVRGNYQAASLHMDSGRAIVCQNVQRLQHTSRRKDLLEIERALSRLDLPAICFSDRSSPYKYRLADFHAMNPTLTGDGFQDVSGAQACFVDLTRWLLLIGNHIDEEEYKGDLPSLARYQAEKIRCAQMFEKWHVRFEEIAEAANEADGLLVLNLRCWYAGMMTLIKGEFYGPEKRFDMFMDSFEEILDFADEITSQLTAGCHNHSFSYEFGYTIPVYLVATRCRDPHMRRRAVSLLQQYPRQEGLWESRAAAAVAEQWIALEEEGLDVRTAGDVPEHKRIRYINTQVNLDEKTAFLRLSSLHSPTIRTMKASW